MGYLFECSLVSCACWRDVNPGEGFFGICIARLQGLDTTAWYSFASHTVRERRSEKVRTRDTKTGSGGCCQAESLTRLLWRMEDGGDVERAGDQTAIVVIDPSPQLNSSLGSRGIKTTPSSVRL